MTGRSPFSFQFAFFLTTLAACGPGERAAEGPNAVALTARVSASEGVELAAACTPTGPELCFNAIDDNCNGVVDEGCGLPTGLLQFTIAWGDAPADVDLAVIAPGGERAHRSGRVAGGLRFDRECPGDGCHDQNIESVHSEGEPVQGRYQVEVKLTELRGAESEVWVQLGARVGSRSFAARFPLSRADDKKILTFSL